MKRKTVVLVLGLLVLAACSKELSNEGPDTPAEGSLQSEITGDCLPKTVTGIHKVSVPLVADSNTISVNVNVATAGTYLITTDTVNGYFFNSTGRFISPGTNAVKLRSKGTPFASGVNNFRISFDSSFCDVQVTVQ